MRVVVREFFFVLFGFVMSICLFDLRLRFIFCKVVVLLG